MVLFAPCPAFTLRAQPRLTEAQAAALQQTPPSLVPSWGTFWSVSRPDYPPLPFLKQPGLPVFLLPDGSYLVDDTTVPFPLPPPTNVVAAARSLLTQPSLATPMLNGAMLADDTDSTNSPAQDDDSTNCPPVLIDPGSIPAFGTFWLMVETNSPPLPTDPCTNCDRNYSRHF